MARTLEERSSGFHDPLSVTVLKTASCHQSKGRLGPDVSQGTEPRGRPPGPSGQNGTRSRSSLIFHLCEPTGVKGVSPEAIQRCRFFGRAGGHPGSRSNRWPGRAGLRPGRCRPDGTLSQAGARGVPPDHERDADVGPELVGIVGAMPRAGLGVMPEEVGAADDDGLR